MPARKQDRKHDQAVEDSFPASDPPATTGIVGPGTDRREHGSRQAAHERNGDIRPTGTPTDDRHATETAYQWEHEKSPQKR